ncbi:MAG: N-acetylmuramic acid 6-phosphate etherase [Chloroflexi bacterium]|nr:N-acetylmuramic acid 6-phosphate etherase [Chloroflexota bacterium]
MLTETPNPRSTQIDQLPTLDILQIMNEEDASVAAAVQRALPQIAQAVDVIVERLRAGGRLIYAGAGTSGRLGVLDAVECVPTFSTNPELVQGMLAGGDRALTHSIEGAEDDRALGRADLLARHVSARDVVVGIAASGRTPYVIGALEAANEAGAATIGIACNEPAPLLDAAQIRIAALVGPEIIAGSTRLKSGTAQKMILNMLSTASMIRLGKVYGNRMVDVKVTNQKLARRAQGMVAEIGGVSEAEAADLLVASGNHAKVAIVMARRGVSADEARALLAAANGHLRPVIDPA